jgi:hypothetical protein
MHAQSCQPVSAYMHACMHAFMHTSATCYLQGLRACTKACSATCTWKSALNLAGCSSTHLGAFWLLSLLRSEHLQDPKLPLQLCMLPAKPVHGKPKESLRFTRPYGATKGFRKTELGGKANMLGDCCFCWLVLVRQGCRS